MVRTHSERHWLKGSVKSIRSYLGFIRNIVRYLCVYRGYQRQERKSEGVVALPVYGQMCLPVHKGYKVFDWYRKAVIKVFDLDVDSSHILREIELLQHVSKFDFAPSIRKWNVEKRWYEEDFQLGTLDASYAPYPPMDSQTVLTKFQDHLVHTLNSLILSQEPKVTNAVAYVTDLINFLNFSSFAKQESTVQEYTRVANFVDFIVGQFQGERDNPILLVFTHGDFVAANMVNTTHGMKIIDWENAGYRSALFDFYSYFFHRGAFNKIPVSLLVSELKEALSIQISGLAKHALEVSHSLKTLEKVYRWTFYIEMICKFVERHQTDKNLDIMKYLQQYLSVFIRYEFFYSHRDDSLPRNLR